MRTLPPLSLYAHFPWCERKCPYCDFNSHERRGQVPETRYVEALLDDLRADLDLVAGRSLCSIFLGGGTPSLFAPASIERLLRHLDELLGLATDVEITLEANPGTLGPGRLGGYRAAGVNRLSLGVQSFDDTSLARLGRIHSGRQALDAIDDARRAGFERLNLDLMYGLPETGVDDALADLRIACQSGVTHLSWYQLTIEPNTRFHTAPPPGLPDHDRLWDLWQAGSELLQAQFERYEVSAWARPGEASRHNLNYWQFGDYLGIGAGAHGKATLPSGTILRTRKTRVPDHYLKSPGAVREAIAEAGLPLEFLMNALRLKDGVPEALFEARTGLPLSCIQGFLDRQRRRGLLREAPWIGTTDQGYLFLDTLLGEVDEE